jgi:hypothetical protein
MAELKKVLFGYVIKNEKLSDEFSKLSNDEIEEIWKHKNLLNKILKNKINETWRREIFNH